MKWHRLWLAVLVAAGSACAAPQLKSIKIAITNPTDQDRAAADITLSIADLRKVAPDFYAGSQIVTATDASTLEQDAAAIRADELPSQVDSFAANHKPEELAFQIDLKPHQTRIVTITYGPPNLIFRLRGDYPPRTDALFSTKIDGMGWESERIAFRLYFDKRNAIDIYGKKRPMLLLDRFATPGYIYHNSSPDGRDIYLVAQALGLGAVAGWVDGSAAHVSDVAGRKWRIISTGPVRAIVEFTYDGWKVGGRTINLISRVVQWAGERGFLQTITSPDAGDFTFATGMSRQHNNIPDIRSRPDATTPWVAMWGPQVVQAANVAVAPFEKHSNLGLAVILSPGTQAAQHEDSKDYLLTFPLKNGAASWYSMAAWDKEAANHPVPTSADGAPENFVNFIAAHQTITSQDQFLSAIHDQVLRMEQPAAVRVLSSAPEAQSAPPDTLHPAAPRSYSQAIALLKQEIDRTARKWAPVISVSNPKTFGAHSGRGFFTEADERTAEWRPQKGFFWTGGFWTGELWDMYKHTRQPKYRRWAELWTSRMAGHEAAQDHDVGFLFFDSSALGYQLTHEQELRQSALRAAARLAALFNPTTQLIAAWGPNGDDSIIDSLMNLQILWWASDETGNPKWREIALKHALRTAQWFVRKDGSTIQSVHYNPGGNRQHFQLHGSGSDRDFYLPNDAAQGQRVFEHTHQGYAWNTTWSRGEAWALYGFAVAYRETHDPRMLATAEKVAGYTLAELPSDGVPWYDFNDQGVLHRNRDSSAAAVIAGGLLQLSRVEPDRQKAAAYRSECERIVHSLIDRYLTPSYTGDSTPAGLLRHGCSTHPSDTGLIYGEYFLLDTLLQLEATGATTPAA